MRWVSVYSPLKFSINVYSYPATIGISIPQGTVIEPLIFITYLNFLLNCEVSGTVISYTDDTVLLFGDASWDGS